MLRFQFHRHVPDTVLTVSKYDQRRQTHPNDAETRKNIIGRMAQQAQMTPLPPQVDARMNLMAEHLIALGVGHRAKSYCKDFDSNAKTFLF
jgi:hypothetical protein